MSLYCQENINDCYSRAQLFQRQLVLTWVSFSCYQKHFLRQFSLFLLEYPTVKLQAKRIKLNLLFKLSYLSSHYALTRGYLNPASNNPALGIQGLNKVNGTCMHPCISYTYCSLLLLGLFSFIPKNWELLLPFPLAFLSTLHSPSYICHTDVHDLQEPVEGTLSAG